MTKPAKHLLLGGAAGVVGLLLLTLLIVMLVAYGGGYNIAASQDHSSFVRWALDTTMKNSVASHAADIEAPEAFSEAMVASGASAYKSMCEHCHAGPGVERAEWARGMLPQPPHLSEEVPHWNANEVFWLVKHGVRMSAMPSFGETHDDQALWEITGFVMRLPGMTASTYAGLGSADPKDH